jgi:hypothetical protein
MPGELEEKEFFFPDLEKNVMVMVPRDGDLTEAFNEVSSFIKTLLANHQLKDDEAGLDPPRPSHAVVREADNHYHLRRLRLHGIA